MTRCTVCDSDQTLSVLRIDDVPVFCNVQWSTRDEAKNATKGTIALEYCRSCSHIFNSEFDPKAVEYDGAYENSLHFSPHFQKYAEGLVDRLIEKYDVRDKTVVEIGCGKGEFISMLCEAGNNTGYGFDASYEPERESRTSSESVKFIQDFYSDAYESIAADFVCCRHVLEHIQYPVPFIEDIKRASATNGDNIAYFEVPNALYSIEDLGIWDLIYEHCSYFSAEYAMTAFRKAGMKTIDVYPDFGNQFLCVEAKTDAAGTQDLVAVPGEREALVRRFSDEYRQKLKEWNEFLESSRKKRERVVVWGAGSKGVTFLNCVDSPGDIAYVVDVNPNKRGLFAAGTGHEIRNVDQLADDPPTQVIVMNPVYADEIRQMLSDAAIPTELSFA